MSNGDWISLTGNVGLRRGDRDGAGAGIGRHMTFGARFRLFAGRTGVTGWWTSGESVYGLGGGVTGKKEAKAGRNMTRFIKVMVIPR